MIKTLNNIIRQDKEKFIVPQSVQQGIPIQAVWGDGIFRIGKNKYSRTYKFMDINFAVASRQDKETMFLDYCELLNSFDSGATTKITINNRRMNKHDFEQSILLPMQEDGLDLYRKEYNDMLLEKVTRANSMVQEKYVTVSVYKKSIEEALQIGNADKMQTIIFLPLYHMIWNSSAKRAKNFWMTLLPVTSV